MRLQNWKTQLRKGVLELCVLNALSAREYYGYDLVQTLKQIEVLQMREGTVYPILARLEDDGLVTSETRASSAGPPRKYVSITQEGKTYVAKANAHWSEMVSAVKRAQSGAMKGSSDGRDA